MQRRFTIVQGGLSTQGPRSDDPAANGQPVRWRVALLRPGSLDEAEIAQWRALAGRQARLDPFADPDVLVTAAQHDPRSRDLVFALAFAVSGTGAERLAGVLPLDMPHPVLGGSARLWHSPLVPHPVQPLVKAGAVPAFVEAVLRHLARSLPRASLSLGRLVEEGETVRALREDGRLRVETRASTAPIPDRQFVEVAARDMSVRIERAETPEGIRDAVERFLLADARRARRPLLADPAAASTLRVAARLLARRGLAEVALGYDARGEVASGAIRIGAAGERVLWRSVGLAEPRPPLSGTLDVDLALAEEGPLTGQAARLRLVIP